MASRSTESCISMTDSTTVNPDSSGCAIADYAEILAVRHGETSWNADGRIQGHLDVELNDIGRQQAAAVADRISKEMPISAVYSSDLKRATETAHIIASTCGVPEVITDPELRERHLGDLQGLVLREAAELKPDAYLASLSPRTDQEIPGGGESFDQLYGRCTSSLQKIGNKHTAACFTGERVVVVTHGGVIRAFHKRSAPTENLPGKIQNVSLNIFRLAGEEWMINTWGDTSHVSKTGYLETAFGGDKTSG
ncbi:phosphoglycerate mutase-like protein 4 isoform X2 [Mangifera indica]|uniref:phosphoglycerate mutase-like protein 4 isoform X2 n=1 Tax=Mangifera indica TaxID=29780 RepID=UPI001CFBC5B7|nr:phosphoglycerate mutase-like protein 4 isoform X2 [Mangifera indica]